MRDQQATRLIFEIGRAGRRGSTLPRADVPSPRLDALLPAGALASDPLPLPELSEPDVIRHYTTLSTWNMSVDTHFYPLGSCTMKYNPKRHERAAAMPAFAELHPYQDEAALQGLLELLFGLQEMLAEIAGLPAVSLQPAAGAQGELSALLIAAAYFRERGERRTKVLIPDSAHGTNPSSAAIAGFDAVTIRSTPAGLVDLEDLRSRLDGETAVFMITNPNTLGVFDPQVKRIAEMLHEVGALVYLDGANMNAILGVARPGDFGADMMHYNVHKTFTGPHGAGGPGAGPIAVREFLAPYLPAPVVVREETRETSDERCAETSPDSRLSPRAWAQPMRADSWPTGAGAPNSAGRYRLDYDRPKSIGRVRSFFGNVGILLRGYCYLRTLGPAGLRAVSENAVLNANYLLARLQSRYPVPQGSRCMHEFVATSLNMEQVQAWRRTHVLPSKPAVSTMDIAKRLLDYGFHAPTVYFPLVVPEAIMIEPTETESKTTLDAFAEAMLAIRDEDPHMVRGAPHTTPISRPDEVRAARRPVLRWRRGVS